MFFIYILITYKKNKKLFCQAYYKDLQKGKELRQQLNNSGFWMVFLFCAGIGIQGLLPKDKGF